MRRQYIRSPETYRDDVRLVFHIEEPWVMSGNLRRRDKSWVQDAEEAKEQIQRHIDGVTRHGNNIDINWDLLCVYCDSDPEVDRSTGQPQCCNEAMNNWSQWASGGYAAPRWP